MAFIFFEHLQSGKKYCFFVGTFKELYILDIQSKNSVSKRKYSENCHASIAQWKYAMLLSNFDDEKQRAHLILRDWILPSTGTTLISVKPFQEY